MFEQQENQTLSTMEESCKTVIAKYLTMDDVNIRQELLFPLKQSLSHPEMKAFIHQQIRELQEVKGNSSYTFLIGFLYRVKEEFSEAFVWLDRAIAMNDPNAMFLKGFMCMRALGIPENKAEAMNYYRKAAALNHVQSIHNLAALVSEGPIDNVDYRQESRDLFFKAAELGNEISRQAFDQGERASRGIHFPFYTKSTPVIQTFQGRQKQQEVLIPVRVATDTGEGNALESGISIQVRHSLPLAFIELALEIQVALIDTIFSALKKIYSDHVNTYHRVFKESPFQAEQLKIKFSENIDKCVQDLVTAMAKGFPQENARDVKESPDDTEQRFTI